MTKPFSPQSSDFTRHSAIRYGAFLKGVAHKKGFNLVEVVLAMCVIAVAFTSLFGVMPVALQNYRHSMNLAMVANIMSQVSAELQQTPASEVLANPATPLPDRYFSDEGQDVTSTSAQAQAVFHVKYEAITTESNAADTDTNQVVASVKTTIFGGATSPTYSTALIPVTVDVYARHGGTDTTAPLATKTIFIPNYN